MLYYAEICEIKLFNDEFEEYHIILIDDRL